ncbi:940_t:CDS:2 [Dentiscutata erythropus]|uniref:940_t:CDS:1 n=1 Tax=Dentiscutata erythropus TaxID=1348616 RepID=A0A9N8WAG3_9GLOM|nr:940_t:CDS:2 [Dentiscutata erythropus]
MISYNLPDLSTDSFDVSNKTNDTLIEIVDKKSDKVEVFLAVSKVLCNKCEYFRIALSDKWAKKDDNYKLKLEVSCDAFKVIFDGICNGSIILNNLDLAFTIDLLFVSDLLLLHDFLDFLKVKLLEENKENWRDNEIIYALKASQQHPSLHELYLVCQDMVAENPMILFDSPEFSSIDEEILLNILKLDMICKDEIVVFDKLIEWGIANTPKYSTITNETSKLSALGTTIEEGLQLIRYNYIHRNFNEFDQIIPKNFLYSSRSRVMVDPKVVSNRFAGIIAAWIDRKDPTEAQYTAVNNPFRFRHVFRMNDNTYFSSRHYRFHQFSNKLPTIKCHEGPSLMIIKLKNSGKIIGAYNPIQWKKGNYSYRSTSESFIFSCDDRFGSNYQLCRVIDYNRAVCLLGDLLKFGDDLKFTYDEGNVKCKIGHEFYEQISLAEGIYEVDEWNVYKVRRKDDLPMRVMINWDLESKIINSDFFGIISTWIDKKDDPYLKSNMPYQFTPIFRMKDNSAFFPKQYYNQLTERVLPTMKCHHGPSLMLMRLRFSGKIIGAYNPLDWQPGEYRTYPTDVEYRSTKESFIFSYELNENNEPNYRLCRVVNFDRAIGSEKLTTNRKDINSLILRFGDDLVLSHQGGIRQNIHSGIFCRIMANGCYEQPPTMPDGNYEVDQWEIFRVSIKVPEI